MQIPTTIPQELITTLQSFTTDTKISELMTTINTTEAQLVNFLIIIFLFAEFFLLAGILFRTLKLWRYWVIGILSLVGIILGMLVTIYPIWTKSLTTTLVVGGIVFGITLVVVIIALIKQILRL